MDNKEQSEWWSDEHFWKVFGPLMFDEERWENAGSEVDAILTLTGASAPCSILDVGCGPGRHSLELAKKGFQVTGIDIQDSYLETAREKSLGITPKPEFIHCDMREYTGKRHYAGAISMFQTIGYFEDPSEDIAVCRAIHDSLESGGWLLMEMDGKEATALNFEERTWLERDGRIILLEYGVDGAWDRLRNRWLFKDIDDTWKEYEFSYRLYSAVELGILLEKSGFTSIEFFGAMDGRPYDYQAERLVALARRP